MKQKVDFAGAFKRKRDPEPADQPVDDQTGVKYRAPSRRGTRHVGAHFDPIVTKQLREIANDEDTSIQSLIGQALNMLFHAKGKPTIAKE